MDDLATILGGEATAADEQPNEQMEPEAPEIQEEPVSEQKGEVKNEEPPSSKENEEPESWTKTAVIDERRKRQEFEKKYQELEAEIAALKQPRQQEAKVERPDVFDDAEGAFKHTEKDFDRKLFEQRVNITKEIVKEKHADFDDMERHFLEMSKSNQALIEKLVSVPNPARFAYETAKNDLEVKKLSDPAYRDQIREEIRKEVLADLAKTQNPSARPELKLPSFANTTSSLKSADKEVEDKSLDALFPPLNKRK